MNAIAVIPARGGSKRIPRKNIREFAGKPMIAWPIATALESGLFDHVIVSTDDPEIAEVARRAGAAVPFIRPPELADDHAGTTPVVAHTVRWAQSEGLAVETVCCIYATAALISPVALRAARDLIGPDCDFSFAALRFRHPPQRGFRRTVSQSPEMLFPETMKVRTQDLEPVWHDAGQFYWAKRETWLKGTTQFSGRARFVQLSAAEAVDIDNEEDWVLAEAILQAGGLRK